MAALVASGCVPIVMILQSRSAARRLFRWAMLVILPTMAISCGMWVSEGERAFLGFWLALWTATVFLAFSLGLGSAASWVKALWLARHPSAKPKIGEPEL